MSYNAASRFRDLIDAATRVFVENGYRRTQMADVATAMGVAKGTVYLYVESKEALFDIACRFADMSDPPVPATLPVPTPPRQATVDYIKARLAQSPVIPMIRSMVENEPKTDAMDDLYQFVSALYDDLSLNRKALKLVGQSARDVPEIAAIWFDATRAGLVELLSRFLGTRISSGLLAPVPDVAAAARTIVETTVFWAVHRHWDLRPQIIDEATAKATVVRFTVSALAQGGYS